MFVKTSKFTTDRINIGKGVFQGDTLSATLFLTVFSHILRYLESESHHGVAIKEEKIVSLAFADDLTVIVKDARSAQRILNTLDKHANNIGLVFKPGKCSSLSVSGGKTDKTRSFKLRDSVLQRIEDTPTKFLGLNIYQKHQKANSARYLHSKLNALLQRVDKLPIRGQYKLELYDRYVSACVRFDLTVDWKCMLEFRRKTYNDLHPGVKNELGFTYQPRVTHAN